MKTINAVPVSLVSASLASALAATLVALPVPVLGADLPQVAQAQRQTVTRADQLPRRSYQLNKLPSEALRAPLDELKPLGAKLEANISADLAAYDILDRATLREMYSSMATLAQLRGDWAAVPGWTAKARALQDKAGSRLTSGVTTDLFSQQRLEKRDAAWLGSEVRGRYGAMPWTDARDAIKTLKGSVETYNPELAIGTFKVQLDSMAKNGSMSVPGDIAFTIIASRMQIELLPTNKDQIVAALQSIIDSNSSAVARADIWTPRVFTIPADAKATPVVVAIWDSGVDETLFRTSPARGMAFDDEAKPATALLRSLGEAQSRWPLLRSMVKGSMDQRAALDTSESRELRAKLAELKADQVKAFVEDMQLAGLYVHGTHVAGIAVDGNPFAQVYAGTVLWSSAMEPKRPTEAWARATAASYLAMVDGFKKANVRVVNMSWRYGAGAYEHALAFHNAGGSPEERKQEALRLFAIERDALKAAIASAPGILFIAGSGNEDNSADFEEYIPAGFELPNLITVGAVDTSGTETSFSTFGKTVAVHANGFEVDSILPGGDRMKLSGTSMASPQVSNLAAKMMALKPELTPTQVKNLILSGADRISGVDGKPGRVNLINPRRSAELAGIAL